MLTYVVDWLTNFCGPSTSTNSPYNPKRFEGEAVGIAGIAITMQQNYTHGLSLRSNFSWNLAGNVVYAGCQWGILVVLAKMTSPEMLGRFALGLAITAPIIMLSQLQLRGVQATDARDEYAFGHYLGLRLVTTSIALLIIGSVVWLGNHAPNVALVILAVGLSKAFESVSDVYYGLMQRHERMDRIAKSRMIKGPLSLAALGVLVSLTGDVLWGVIGLAATWCLLLFAYDMKNAAITVRESRIAQSGPLAEEKRMIPDFNPQSLARLAWLAFPLGVVMALISLNTNIPRYFIENTLGVAELGIFAALAYLVVAGNTLVSAMGQSVVPRLARYYAEADIAQYKGLLLRMLGIGLALGIAGILVALLAGRPLLMLLYRPEYADRAQVLVWLMTAACVSYLASFLGYAMTAARYFKVQLPLFMLVTATTCVGSLLLIPRFALTGAALALAAGSLVQLITGGLVVSHVLRGKPMKVTAS